MVQTPPCGSCKSAVDIMRSSEKSVVTVFCFDGVFLGVQNVFVYKLNWNIMVVLKEKVQAGILDT